MKQRMKKVIAIFAVAAMTASMFTGCGGGKKTSSGGATAKKTGQSTEKKDAKASEAGDKGATPRNETLYFGGQQWGTINDCNPMSANPNNAMVVAPSDSSRVLSYETLFLYNMMDGKLYPLLGKDYAWNDTQTEMTIHLNEDAKWNDGTALTADDVAYTWEAHKKYESPTGVDYSKYIDTITATDAHTAVIKAKLNAQGKAENPLKVLEYLPKVYVMQKAYLQKVEKRTNSDKDKMKTDPMKDYVASGPYKSYYDDDQKVVLIRDDKYWGQAKSMFGKLPAPKYIAHTIYKDNAAAQVALSKGEMDVAQVFITDVQKLWEEDNLPITTYIDEPPYGLCATMPSCYFNLEKPGLDQVAVRKAIAMATDFDQIIASAMSNQSPSFGDVPRSLMNPTDAEQALVDKDKLKGLQFNDNDIEGAKKLLDDAGITDTDGDGVREYKGQKLSYKAECPDGWTDWMASLEVVASSAKKIGIDIQTYFPDTPTFTDDYSKGNFDIVMESPSGSSISNPWGRCMQLMSSDYADLKVNLSGNFGKYRNQEADDILAKIPYEKDQAKLKEYYTRLSEIYLTDVPSFALMYRPQLFYVVNETVWTGYPMKDDGSNIPPADCTDGYGVWALYNLQLVK